MPSLDDVLNKLRAIIVDLSSIDLWPPWDAAQAIVNAIGEAVAIAGTPPPPDPETVRDAATDWTVLGPERRARPGRTRRSPRRHECGEVAGGIRRFVPVLGRCLRGPG